MISLAMVILAIASPIDSGSIAASSATYDGALLILDGEVVLDHGFGKMQAEKAVLTKEEEGEFPFTSIELAEAVHLTLPTKAEVDCERASLDFKAMHGTLTSPKQVHYVDTLHATPFELFSPHLDIDMVKENYEIKSAQAQKGVHLIYDALYHLNSDSILFAENFIKSDDACTWSFQESKVNAKNFRLDLTQKLLQLVEPAGNLDGMQFTSDTLTWDHARNLLVLNGTIKFHAEGKRGIADTLTYDPVSRTCILKAHPGAKVLFTRELDKLSMAANEVHILYNQETKEQEVRGIGNIVLSLTQDEQNLLNQVFPHASTP